jgi:glycosyltransferase involved in cell wall biosynthesis
MKILIINSRYSQIGGPERYLFNLQSILEANNHEVIPFSIDYPSNVSTKYKDFFASPLTKNDSVFFKDQKKNLSTLSKTLERNFFSKEVEEKLIKLIDFEKPDFALVLLYLRKLSPSIITALEKKNIPFAVRLSDFSMICPGQTLYRKGKICESCIGGNLINSVIHRCVHNSTSASLVNYFATKYHHYKGYFNKIKYFISPSQFLIDKMIEGGFGSKKFFHIPTFANSSELLNQNRKQNQIIYAGRIEEVKGVHVLLEAICLLNELKIQPQLLIAGIGNEDYIKGLKVYCQENQLTNVSFVGNLPKNELFKLMSESVASIVPSLWYENLPNSALESLSLGTPVIAPDLGCFPEFVISNKTGLLYQSGNSKDLAEKIKIIVTKKDLFNSLSLKAHSFIKNEYSSENHYNKLMDVVNLIIKDSR